MKFTEAIYTKAEAELEKRRKDAEALAKLREKELVAKYPQLADIEKDVRDAALEAIKCIGSAGTADIASLAKKNLEAQEKRKLLLKSIGLPEDYLDPPYTCPLCRDSGIYDGKLCVCHLKLLKKLASADLSCSSVLASSTFDTFDLNLYSDKKDMTLGYSPRKYMTRAYSLAKEYATGFSRDTTDCLLFCGATGLGKTHLALAIMNELSERNYNVYYGTAWKVVKEMEKEQFGKSDGNILEEIETNDLLILDDLGTEFETQFSKAAVYQLINNALLTGMPLIICTNLSMEELENRYGEKVTSRLNAFEVFDFVGTDIRQILK